MSSTKVAGEMTAKLQDGVRNGGQVLVYGALAGMQFTGSVISSLFRDVTIKGYWVTPNTMALSALERVARVQQVVDLMAAGVVVPHSGKTFGLDQINDAFEEANRLGHTPIPATAGMQPRNSTLKLYTRTLFHAGPAAPRTARPSSSSPRSACRSPRANSE